MFEWFLAVFSHDGIKGFISGYSLDNLFSKTEKAQRPFVQLFVWEFPAFFESS